MSTKCNNSEAYSPSQFISPSSVPIPRRACRMSWFLVQQEPSKSLSIIHSVDIVGDSSASIYLDQIIRFQRDQSVLTGLILSAADERYLVEVELKKHLDAQNALRLSQGVDLEWLVLQYSRAPNNIVHAAFSIRDCSWYLDRKTSNKVFITEEHVQRMATVLYVADNETVALEEIKTLKSRCFNTLFDDPSSDSESKNKRWLLIQYSSGLNNVIYKIINQCETVWDRENLYKDTVVYINDGIASTVHQSIIIKKYLHRDEAEIDLQSIQENSLLSIFPLEKDHAISFIDYKLGTCKYNEKSKRIDVEYIRFDRPAQTDFKYPKEVPSKVDYFSDYLKTFYTKVFIPGQKERIEQKLDEMEEKMDYDEDILFNVSEALKLLKRAMNKKMEDLEEEDEDEEGEDEDDDESGDEDDDANEDEYGNENQYENEDAGENEQMDDDTDEGVGTDEGLGTDENEDNNENVN